MDSVSAGFICARSSLHRNFSFSLLLHLSPSLLPHSRLLIAMRSDIDSSRHMKPSKRPLDDPDSSPPSKHPRLQPATSLPTPPPTTSPSSHQRSSSQDLRQRASRASSLPEPARSRKRARDESDREWAPESKHPRRSSSTSASIYGWMSRIHSERDPSKGTSKESLAIIDQNPFHTHPRLHRQQRPIKSRSMMETVAGHARLRPLKVTSQVRRPGYFA